MRRTRRPTQATPAASVYPAGQGSRCGRGPLCPHRQRTQPPTSINGVAHRRGDGSSRQAGGAGPRRVEVALASGGRSRLVATEGDRGCGPRASTKGSGADPRSRVKVDRVGPASPEPPEPRRGRPNLRLEAQSRGYQPAAADDLEHDQGGCVGRGEEEEGEKEGGRRRAERGGCGAPPPPTTKGVVAAAAGSRDGGLGRGGGSPRVALR